MNLDAVSKAAREASDAVCYLGNERFNVMRSSKRPAKGTDVVLLSDRGKAVALLRALDALLEREELAAPVNVGHAADLIAASAEDIAFDWNVGRDLRTFVDALKDSEDA